MGNLAEKVDVCSNPAKNCWKAVWRCSLLGMFEGSWRREHACAIKFS
jgi:hypothetical protein